MLMYVLLSVGCVNARSCGLAVGMGDRDDLGGVWCFSGRISKVRYYETQQNTRLRGMLF